MIRNILFWKSLRLLMVNVVVLLLSSAVSAQTVSNVTAEQQGNALLIHYSLASNDPCEVSLFVSLSEGSGYTGPLLRVSGDVGKNISSGSRTIRWEVLEEMEQLVGNNIQFKVSSVSRIEQPVTFAAEMPQYPGGEAAMTLDIQSDINYPEMERENGIQGKVYVQFVVEKDGSVTNVKVVRGVPGGTNLSTEAEKAVKKLKKFKAASQNGKEVRYSMTWPVDFRLR
jgi:TonB family protein